MQLSKRVSHATEMTEEQKARFYSDWFYSAIRLLTSIPKYQTVERIASFLDLPPSKVNEVLQFLVSCGLCRETNGIFELGVAITQLASDSPHGKHNRLNWRLKAMERASDLTQEELMWTCPCSISEDDFHEFREELIQLIKRFYGRVRESKSERLACVNIDWFFVKK